MAMIAWPRIIGKRAVCQYLGTRASQSRPRILRSGILAVHYRSLSTRISATDQSSVRIVEVGARDGLQNIKQQVSTPIKVELIQRLAAAGLRNIEATSFVSPKWIPQLADAPDVMKQVMSLSENGVSLPVLAPNLKGLQRAIEAGAKEVVVFASASEGFSQKNTNCTVDEALGRAREVSVMARERGLAVRGVVSCIFACPYDGPTEPSAVLRVVESLLNMGCYEVGLGDTLGVGTPRDVERLLDVLLARVEADKLAGHFHDTYGQAVANVVKAYEFGLRTFDSSIAGLGGCPYAKGATGNLATEDIIYLFDQSGIDTGVDLSKLTSIGSWISQQIGKPNGSRAGAAISAKNNSKVATTAEPEQQVAKLGLSWQIIQDTGEYSVSRAGHVVKVSLTRPRNGNALTNAMVEGLTNVFRNLALDKTVFHILLTAEGKFFCTGMDLSSGSSSSSTEASTKSDYYQKVVDLFSAIDNAPQTTIAVIDGPCYGGGVGLGFACDIRLVSSRARFTMTEIKLGLVPAIISKYMIREWGISFLREAMITGREVNPVELQRIGAVHGVAEDVDKLMQLAESYLKDLALCAPRSASICKELIRAAWTDPGGRSQEEKIERSFANMMKPGSEGEFGLQQFRKKVKGIAWDQFWSNSNTAR